MLRRASLCESARKAPLSLCEPPKRFTPHTKLSGDCLEAYNRFRRLLQSQFAECPGQLHFQKYSFTSLNPVRRIRVPSLRGTGGLVTVSVSIPSFSGRYTQTNPGGDTGASNGIFKEKPQISDRRGQADSTGESSSTAPYLRTIR